MSLSERADHEWDTDLDADGQTPSGRGDHFGNVQPVICHFRFKDRQRRCCEFADNWGHGRREVREAGTDEARSDKRMRSDLDETAKLT